MSAETELFAVLDAAAALEALVADRIYPDAIPEDKDLPAVVYVRTETDYVRCLDNSIAGQFAKLQVTAWAVTRTAADAIADAVSAALVAAGHPPENRVGGADEETGLFAVSLGLTWFTT